MHISLNFLNESSFCKHYSNYRMNLYEIAKSHRIVQTFYLDTIQDQMEKVYKQGWRLMLTWSCTNDLMLSVLFESMLVQKFWKCSSSIKTVGKSLSYETWRKCTHTQALTTQISFPLYVFCQSNTYDAEMHALTCSDMENKLCRNNFHQGRLDLF